MSDDQRFTTADFYAYMPAHRYIFVPSRELWPASSVNARCESSTATLSPTDWLDEHHAIDQMVWAPGAPMVVRDKIVSNGGWIDHNGCAVFNLYISPQVGDGNPYDANPWINHIEKVFGAATEHIIRWLAHRAQRPGDKINHALVLGGGQGIGKDTLLEPVKHAVGAWNFNEVAPAHLLGRFNGFVKSVILRISEARDLGDVDRFAFYDHMKIYTAAPPDVLRCDEKNLREHAVMNVCGVVITSNHKTDGIYLPPDDRRHFVAWSDATREEFGADYWNYLWKWYARNGMNDVASYLMNYDLSGFDPKAPPPKTSAWHDIVDANRAPEDAELADALTCLGDPDAVTLGQIAARATTVFKEWLGDRRNRRQIPHRLEAAGYSPVRNDFAKDGLWVMKGKRQMVYGRTSLTIRDRTVAAQTLADAAR